ncbi:UvrD-helicase domain-containing protein, partial [Campylobacter jejuni]|nr:UvrD-helicase domain-containing protein [Campylobacter jejuni]
MSQFEPFLALEASAGSGKTFALSVRFVALILKGARINEILALTFTKKAANEMQKRIIETFLNLEKENKTSECNELCKLLGKDKEELISLRDAKK